MEKLPIAKRSSKKVWISIAVLVVIALIIVYFVFLRDGSQDIEFLTGDAGQGSLQNTVNATGLVQAVLTVQVGSQVTGQIQNLYADFNSVVKRGQLLAKLDPRNYQAQLENSTASLAATRARMKMVEADMVNQDANLVSARASLEAAKVTRENTQLILKRYTELAGSGVISQNDLDTAKANYDGAVARYNQSAANIEQVQAQILSTKASYEQSKAQVRQAEAALEQAKVNLEYTDIYSPVDGVVISRAVDVGQTVTASLQAPTLFLIANDLTKMQVNASVDEADIGKISASVETRFTVDAYPNSSFIGRIAEVRLNPQTVQNVVTYSVIINVDNPELKLKPGMTANISMTVDKRDNVVKIPNAALRYLPPGVTREQLVSMLQSSGTGNRMQAPEGGPGSSPPPSPDAMAAAPAANPSRDSSAGTGPSSPGRTRPDWQNMTEEERAAFRARMEARRNEGGQEAPAGFRSGRPEGNTRPGGGYFSTRTNATGAQVILAPGQDWDPAAKIQFPAPRVNQKRPAIVWVLEDNKPASRKVLLGITDGVNTEVVTGDIKPGEKIIIGDTSQIEAANQSTAPRAPFSPMGGMGGRPGGGMSGGRR